MKPIIGPKVSLSSRHPNSRWAAELIEQRTLREDGPMEIDWRKRWPRFMLAVHERLEAGEMEYEDSSFRRPASELLDEVQEELTDLAGWAFILWCRVQDMRQADTGG